jgi:hypothetical protein
MLILLTATGARPEAFAVTEKLAAAQDYDGEVHWVIVDDGEVAQPVTFSRPKWEVTVVRPEPFWSKGQNTQARNLLAGLDIIPDDAKVVVWEDDDYMAPSYLRWVDRKLRDADLVGESHARYYNVPRRIARELSNNTHASLCSTGVKNGALKLLREVCKPGVQYIDIDLWRGFKGSKILERGDRVVGIKGLPGRCGIGMGHKSDFSGKRDPNLAILRSWIGNDVNYYA